jgi:hypothetical protein
MGAGPPVPPPSTESARAHYKRIRAMSEPEFYAWITELERPIEYKPEYRKSCDNTGAFIMGGLLF